ncbi:MAG: DUF3810 family protein, partial [Anaerolineae bacterium]
MLLVLFHWPWFVEEIYARGIGPAVSIALTAVTGRVPFSVGEVVLPALGVWLLGPAMLAMARGVRRRPGSGGEVVRQVVRLAAAGTALAAGFYGLWGLDYARRDIVTRQGWQAQAEARSSD